MTGKQIDAISNQIDSILTSVATEFNESEKNIHKVDESTLTIDGQVYRIVDNYREGFEIAAFEARYQDYFEKFDFIVGDWGYEQLRLRGFYQLNKRKVPREQIIDFLEDYLNEYCNFGCRYFVIAKEEAFLKYNQLIKGQAPVKKVKKPSKPVINTKNENPAPAPKVPHIDTPKNKPVEKTEAFHIKKSKSAKMPKSNNKAVKPAATSALKQSKRNFVIKQMSK